MKRILICLLAIVLFFCGCENSTSDNSITTTKSTTETTTESTTEEQIPLLWETTVVFDESNKIEFYVSQENPEKLNVLCVFDGTQPEIEYSRYLALTGATAQYSSSGNLFIAILSGEYSGVVNYGNSIYSFKMELPETYEQVSDDEINDNVFNESYEMIEEALSEHLDK